MNQAILTYDFLEEPTHMLRGNVTTQVTELLRKAIVSLELQPGTPIDKPAICAQLNISRSPVSEALARLQAEGLVDILPQRGSVVSLIRVGEVSQYLLIRRALETEAILVLTEKYTDAELDTFRQSIDQQRTAAVANDQPLFHQLDRAFHALLYSGSRLERVRDTIHHARANLDRAQHLIDSPRRLIDIVEQHTEIVDAIAARDAQTAATAMRQHVESTTAQFFIFAKTHPHMFADDDTPLI